MRYLWVLILLVVCLIPFACSQSTDTTTTTSAVTTTTVAGSPAAISIASFAFNPSSLTIIAGTTVTWTNNDSVAHDVVSNAGPASFSSGTIAPGAAYSFAFTIVGTCEYHCGIHPSMTGTIIVQ